MNISSSSIKPLGFGREDVPVKSSIILVRKLGVTHQSPDKMETIPLSQLQSTSSEVETVAEDEVEIEPQSPSSFPFLLSCASAGLFSSSICNRSSSLFHRILRLTLSDLKIYRHMNLDGF